MNSAEIQLADLLADRMELWLEGEPLPKDGLAVLLRPGHGCQLMTGGQDHDGQEICLLMRDFQAFTPINNSEVMDCADSLAETIGILAHPLLEFESYEPAGGKESALSAIVNETEEDEGSICITGGPAHMWCWSHDITGWLANYTDHAFLEWERVEAYLEYWNLEYETDG